MSEAPHVCREHGVCVALATVTGNLTQLVTSGINTSEPWKMLVIRESEQTWNALYAHGVLPCILLVDSPPNLSYNLPCPLPDTQGNQT